MQHEFVCKVKAIEKQKELIKQSLGEVENLFNARMDYFLLILMFRQAFYRWQI